MSYFPMYIELKNASCLVVGGGQVAVRKVEVLLDFGAQVRVVAPKIDERLKNNPQIQCVAREFGVRDIEGMALVVAATGQGALNHEISLLCKKQRIPVNAVDQKEDCTFIFPSYVKRGEVTAAVTTGGASPTLARYLKNQLEHVIPWGIGTLAQALEGIRPLIKDRVPEEKQRKRIYKRLLETGLDNINRDLGETELERVCQTEAERLIREAQDGYTNRNKRF